MTPMLDEAQHLQKGDGNGVSANSVKVGPPPEWAVIFGYDDRVGRRPDDKATHLLWSRQFHAEQRAAFFHTGLRLETMAAARQYTQWRLPLDPAVERVTVHSIKIRRGDEETEYARPETMRVQPPAHGPGAGEGWTLSVPLGDVRVGDILETRHTVERRPAILPTGAAQIFEFPAGAQAAKYFVSVRFASGRPLRWRSSSADLTPAETLEGAETLWTWAGENRSAAPGEPNTPPWHIPWPWIQVSDCADWGELAGAFARAWSAVAEPDDPAVAEIAAEISREEPDPARRALRALRMIQEEYSPEDAGRNVANRPPAAPGIVAQRRAGDSRDLAFLLAQTLRRLGLPARVILVNGGLGKSVATLLPMESLFDRALVEFQAQDERRWVDPAAARQAGGELHGAGVNYGMGLPVDADSGDLASAPRRANGADVHHLKEVILLDTSGRASLLSAFVRAKGAAADVLRRQLEADGAEKFAADRLQQCANRFGHARRSGTMDYRDDREANEFSLAEAFEIKSFLSPHQNPGLCQFSLPNNFVVECLRMPDSRPRQAPFALPYPCSIIHALEIRTPGLRPVVMPRRRVDSALLHFDREMKSANDSWAMTLKLSTTGDAVQPEQIAEHRQTIEEIRSASVCALLVPAGHRHPAQPEDFGKLPRSASDHVRRAALPKLDPPAGLDPLPELAPPTPAPARDQTLGPAGAGSLPQIDLSGLPDPAILRAADGAGSPGWIGERERSGVASEARRSSAAQEGAEDVGDHHGEHHERHRGRRRRSHSRSQSESEWQTIAMVVGIVGGVALGVILYFLFLH